LTIGTAKNDHWCTNRHMSTKTVPTVYQSSKTVKRQSIFLISRSFVETKSTLEYDFKT